MSGQLPVAIVGGGLAGLVAARELKQRGIAVRLFEASDQLGGLARTVHDDQGFSFDFGAHFITNRLADELHAADLCRDVPYYGETVVARSGTYSYPLGFARNPRYLSSFLKSAIRRNGRPPQTAAEQMASMYGERMAEDIAIPLLEGWSGHRADELSPAVAQKLDEGLAKTVWLRAASVAMRRAITIGYTREKPSSVRVWHVYPQGGVGTLIDRLATELADVVQTSSPVQSINVEEEVVRSVTVNEEEIPVIAVMSTAPVHILSRLVQGTPRLDYLADFEYRPMVFVNLLLEGRNLIPDVVTWFTDPDLPFFRLTETPISMPWLAPEGKTTLMADHVADVGDETWSADDDALAEKTLASIETIVPDIRDRYLGCRVLRTPLAYPIFLNEYEELRQDFARGTGIAGLYSIGRNGEFAHILMEDVYWRTKRKVDDLQGQLTG